MTFGIEKLEWGGYPKVKKMFEDMFIRFDRIHERDRRTDTQTETTRRHSIVFIATQCNNWARINKYACSIISCNLLFSKNARFRLHV